MASTNPKEMKTRYYRIICQERIDGKKRFSVESSEGLLGLIFNTIFRDWDQYGKYAGYGHFEQTFFSTQVKAMEFIAIKNSIRTKSKKVVFTIKHP